MDAVFKALADPSRRALLDRLRADNGQSLRELSVGLDMSRQAVTKHLAVLEAANLVSAVRTGRQRLHYLNAAPISDISQRWIGHYDRDRIHALADLKLVLEGSPMSHTSAVDSTVAPEFVHTSYIRTTPEQLWRALTEPEFTRRYWGGTALRSDWTPGSPVLWQHGPDQEFRDIGGEVLEADPYRLLSYRWHNYQPEHAEHFGWSAERLAELREEPLSVVTFTLEPAGQNVKLTVVHNGFAGETEMLRTVSGANERSGGWPELLSSLKTLLETGEPLRE
ncbi:ArsR/SmtB family transcription factor [Prauserella cavernicola]|uniref:Metalloregulator ArsR/SmtB family transcription factor n=1 Tax=Prauserella cavernicola TaxID=2800127 RepID=A0A934QLG8_9PSEU|nr:metalloregulator ArsR/SmtB family transcription factor [Prauserella cavernicola]MBK1782782.1 metalloregulator ArsR/SmtB family transcription factor [Prauserella cavernicola]